MTVAFEPISDASMPKPRRFAVTRALEIGVLAVVVGVAIVTYFPIADAQANGRLISPPLMALLLVANLIPAVALLVLLGRRIA